MRVFNGADIRRELQDIQLNVEEALMRTLPGAKAHTQLSAAAQQLQQLVEKLGPLE